MMTPAAAAREALDQVIGEDRDLVLGDGHVEVEHHAHDRAPAFGRVAGARTVDVVAAAAQSEEARLARPLGKVRRRRLRIRRRHGTQESCRDRGKERFARHGSSEHQSGGRR
jgi:hypothetical protein